MITFSPRGKCSSWSSLYRQLLLITLKEGILVLQPMYCNTGYWLFEQTDQIFYLLNEEISPRDLKNKPISVQLKKTLFLQFCFVSLAVRKCHVSPLVSVIAWDGVVTEPFCVWILATLFAAHNTHFFFRILLLWLVQNRQMCFYQF